MTSGSAVGEQELAGASQRTYESSASAQYKKRLLPALRRQSGNPRCNLWPPTALLAICLILISFVFAFLSKSPRWKPASLSKLFPGPLGDSHPPRTFRTNPYLAGSFDPSFLLDCSALRRAPDRTKQTGLFILSCAEPSALLAPPVADSYSFTFFVNKSLKLFVWGFLHVGQSSC